MPEDSVTAYDITVPAWDYITNREWAAIEKLAVDTNQTQQELDMACFKVFVDSRTKKKFAPDPDGPIDEALFSAVYRLLAPFERALRKRTIMKQAALQAQLEPPQLREQIDLAEQRIVILRDILLEKESASMTGSDE